MNLNNIFSVVGKILFLLAAVQIIPAALAFYYGEIVYPFLISIAISATVSLVMIKFSKPNNVWTVRESYAVVAFSWLFSAFFCAIPFLFYGLSPLNAFFESMSGVTATGASVLTDIGSMPQSFLFWRSLMQWLGGLGVVALFLAVIPKVNMRGRQLYKTEFSGPTEDKIRPKISSTAKILWRFYIGATLILIALLCIFKFPLYDAVVFALSTVSSGGFTPYNENLLPFSNFKVELVVIFFMLLAGTNFALIYKLTTKKAKNFFKDEEFRVYILFFVIISAVLSLVLVRDMHYDFLTAIRYSIFQVSSLTSTTGFAIADYNTWSQAAKILLLLAMFTGGCSGSTAGGPTFVRWIVLLRHARRDLFKFVHPHAIKPIKYNGKSLSEDVVASTVSFMILYILIFVGSTVILGVLGLDMVSAAVTSIASLGNIGPVFGLFGPFESFITLSAPIRLVIILNMWIGRLELYTVILLFTREFWKK
ncbi:MAG: TrkH family potassium uptake protein [Methanimicrococcus sp.]|nr:TrkH family potassium uptake protein [Methanimicrococcus sp.]